MTARTVLHGEAQVRAAVGALLGTSDWIEITPQRLADFARATGTADSSYLAIGLSNMLLPQIVEVTGFAMGINYGTDAVTFGPTLQQGDRVRASATLVEVTEVKRSIQTRMTISFEVAPAKSSGSEYGQPGCVIESLSRWLE